jgi:TolA-binding protein
MDLGRRRDALEAFRSLARSDPETRFGAEAMYRAATLLREEGRAEEARALLDELARIHPEGRFTEAALFERALVLKESGDLEGAAEALSAFEERFPASDNMPEVLRELALVSYERKDRESERAAWSRLLERFGRSPAAFDARWGLAALAEEDSALEEAARLYEKAAATTSRPEAAEAAFRSAECLARAGRRREACEGFVSLAERFPKAACAPRALAKAGGLALESGDAEEAARLLERAEELSPGVASVPLGRALVATGRAGEAEKVLERFLERAEPDSDEARRCRIELARAKAALGEREAAERLLQSAVAGREDELAALAQRALGEVLMEAGDLKGAERAFYQLLLLFPGANWQAEARYRLAQTNERLHDYARARSFYAELVRENPKSRYAERATERLEALAP